MAFNVCRQLYLGKHGQQKEGGAYERLHDLMTAGSIVDKSY